jgi:hypothetical protein
MNPVGPGTSQDGIGEVPGHLQDEQGPDDPAHSAGVIFMGFRKPLPAPAGEVRIGADQYQPGDGRHRDIDAGEGNSHQMSVHDGQGSGFCPLHKISGR